MHQTQDAAHLPLSGEDCKEDRAVLLVVLECPVDESEASFHQISHLRRESELPGLRQLKRPHHPARVTVEDVPCLGEDLAVADDHLIDGFLASAEELGKDPRLDPVLFADTPEGERGDEVDATGAVVVVPHEGLAPPQDVLFGIAECGCYFSLKLESQLVRRSSGLIVHFGADAQQEIMRLLQCAPLPFPEDLFLDECRGGVGTGVEHPSPEKVLIISQTATA